MVSGMPAVITTMPESKGRQERVPDVGLGDGADEEKANAAYSYSLPDDGTAKPKKR